MNLDFIFASELFSVLLTLGAAVLLVVGYLWVFWLLYVLVMGMYRAHLAGRLQGLTLFMASPVVLIAILVDWVANWLIATVVFQDLPAGPFELVTGRLTRYINEPYPRWRWKNFFAAQICAGLLDVFDPTGQHCR